MRLGSFNMSESELANLRAFLRVTPGQLLDRSAEVDGH